MSCQPPVANKENQSLSSEESGKNLQIPQLPRNNTREIPAQMNQAKSPSLGEGETRKGDK